MPVSKKGIGAVMLQPDKNIKNTSSTSIPNNLRPVSYASKRLTSTESNFSNIEHELLGVVFSKTHFKHFTYRCKVHVITNHKPLVSLFKKSLSSALPRLARMLLHVMYQPGTKMHLVMHWVDLPVTMIPPKPRLCQVLTFQYMMFSWICLPYHWPQ